MFFFIQPCSGQSGSGFLPHARPASGVEAEAGAVALALAVAEAGTVAGAVTVAGAATAAGAEAVAVSDGNGGTIELGVGEVLLPS